MYSVSNPIDSRASILSRAKANRAKDSQQRAAATSYVYETKRVRRALLANRIAYFVFGFASSSLLWWVL